MKHFVLILLLAASIMTANAQSSVKPVNTAKSVTTSSRSAARVSRSAKAVAAAKLPPGVPVVSGIKKTLYTASLRYQEIKIGEGPVAESNKLYKVRYTGWRATDGIKFDSSYDHPGQPLRDKDGKPVLGADGKPKLGDPQPLVFPQGMGRVIAGFDQGFEGMRVGGKRRIFIPWQLGYGLRAIPDHGLQHPGIPAKSNLIFDVELLAVTDLPTPPARPAMLPRPLPGAKPGEPAKPSAPAASVAKPAATTTPATSSTAPAATSKPAASTVPSTPVQTQTK